MSIPKKDMHRIQSLVGTINENDLRYVDSFLGIHVAMFMPQGGACFYALSPLHTHPSYMFVLPFNDQTVIRFQERLIRAEAGRLSAFAPDLPHQEMPSDQPPRYIAIFIAPELFDKVVSHYPDRKEPSFQGESYPVRQPVRDSIRRFMHEADNRMPGSDDVLSALEIELCHAIWRDICNIEMGRDRVSVRLEVDRVIEHMHEHLSEKTTVEDLALVAHMSRSHFLRVFRQETGSPPMEYLNTMRLERAKKLLSAGEMSVAEVALASGFSSPSYLTERFVRKFKVSPSQYRKSIISKEKDTPPKD